MTMLETMARAAWVKVQEQVPEKHRLTDWALVPEEAKENFRNFVRAALIAAREPTEAMIDAGANCREALLAGMNPRERATVVIAPYPSGTMWVAMIDEILKETP